MGPGSIDAIVTDPPYEIGFMGRSWDASGIAFRPETWAECLHVLKPGGHMLVFGFPRNYHRLTCAVEDAGFEVRDCIMWCYGSGFPKSLNVSKAIDKAAGAERRVVGMHPNPASSLGNGRTMDGGAANLSHALASPATPEAARWEGWGTALKPAYEPILVARKPLERTVAGNVLAHGTGAIDIDGCRVETTDDLNGGAYAQTGTERDDGWRFQRGGAGEYRQPKGRWPANLILDEEAGQILDEQSGECPSGAKRPHVAGAHDSVVGGLWEREGSVRPCSAEASAGGAARFFYCAKASKSERNEGLEAGESNHPPTVKPAQLMAYLCRLVTPPGGVILDPFAGSASTGLGAQEGGFGFIGIEQDAGHRAVGRKRLDAQRRRLARSRRERGARS